MPVARYFLFVGGVLLALLFAMDAYLPREPALTSNAAATPVENPTLRIHSDRKWPERVVYDTSLPTIGPPKADTVVAAAVPAAVPPSAAEMSAKARVRESFAQFRPTDDPKPEAKALPKRKIARVRTAPPMRVAQQPHFGWFASNIW
jgi:hypothetical protein